MLCRWATLADRRKLGLGSVAITGTMGDSPELQETRLIGTSVRGTEGPRLQTPSDCTEEGTPQLADTPAQPSRVFMAWC